LVKGERNKRSVCFIHADAYETFHLADFIVTTKPVYRKRADVRLLLDDVE